MGRPAPMARAVRAPCAGEGSPGEGWRWAGRRPWRALPPRRAPLKVARRWAACAWPAVGGRAKSAILLYKAPLASLACNNI